MGEQWISNPAVWRSSKNNCEDKQFINPLESKVTGKCICGGEEISVKVAGRWTESSCPKCTKKAIVERIAEDCRATIEQHERKQEYQRQELERKKSERERMK